MLQRILTLAFFLFTASALVGCSKQAEGERCDTNNGSLDCETGLVCRSASQLSLPGNTVGFALCCPIDGIIPNEDACRAGATQPPEEPIPDAGGAEPQGLVEDAAAATGDAG